jgi:hypothetical protein
MFPAYGCNVQNAFRSARTDEKGNMLRSVLCICSVYFAVEVFRIYVDYQSQTVMLIDFWNIEKFIKNWC